MRFGFIQSGTPAPLAGRHLIDGTVTVNGNPAPRLVVVFDRRNFSMIAATTSDSVSGVWEIKGIPEFPERSLLVVSLDSAGAYNAEVADYVSQVTA